MAHSYQQAVSDGTMVALSISIAYLDRSEISVLFDEVLTTAWAWVGSTGSIISFSPAVPDGTVVRVIRRTDASELRHSFVGGAAFSAKSLDEDLLQALHIAQEAAEGNQSGEFFQDLNMHGFRVYNIGPAVGTQDALTLGQYQADALGAYQAKLDAEAARDVAAAFGTANGATLVGYTPTASGVPTNIATVLNTLVSLKTFGAVGDGVANDTPAVLAAKAYMLSTGNNVSVTPGVYLCDPFALDAQVYAGQAGFIGTDRDRCVLRRRGTGAGAFVTYGAISGTVYQSGVGFSHLTVDGGASTNGDAFRGYDIVRSNFYNVRFTGGAITCHLYGGISISFYSCVFDQGKRGLKIEKFSSLAGGGWPNIIRIIGGEIVDNTEQGLYFDNGRMLIMRDVEVEGNGTTLGAANEGGVYIGPNIGEEIIGSDTYSIGLVSSGNWFESNKGAATISLNSGINVIKDSNHFEHASEVTNDVVINGGRYHLDKVNITFSKTANVLENSGTIAGSSVTSSDIANLSVNPLKTTIHANNRITKQGGTVPVIGGLTDPLIQQGSVATGSGTGVDVVFPIAYGSIPRVFPVVSNGPSSTQLTQAVISNISTTGFHVSGMQMTSGSTTLSQANLGVLWLAVGTL